MSGQLELGLNQASISINKTSARSLVSDSIVALYQIDECYGCPLDRLEFGDGANQTLLVDTKYSIDLELRRINKQQHLNHNLEDRSRFVCNFAKLSLRSQARYQIDIQEDANSTIIGGNGFSCSLQTLNDGECSSCPLALLFFVILLVTAMERVYALIVSRNKQRAAAANSPRRRPSKLPAPAIVGDNLKQQGVDNEPLAEDDGGGGGNEDDQAESATITEQEAGLTVACHSTEDVNNNTNVVITNSTSTAVSVATVTPPEGATIKRTRIESLDAFRGLTIAGMIMVNYGGAGYKLLEHQPWDGLTPADLVFPFFVFSMGASIALSNKSLSKQGKSLQNMLVKILRRATILLLLGLCLNSKWLDIQTQGLDKLRLTGVLQRFSVSYFIVASMYAIKLSVIKWIKAQSLYRVPFVTRLVGIIFEYMTALNYLAIYIYVTFFLYYSDSCPAGYLGPGGMTENGIYANCTGGAAAWLDRAVLGTNHLYLDRQLMEVFKTKVTHDPEGLLGNTTSVLLTFVGLQCGKILGRTKPRCSTHRARVRSFLGWQLILALISISAIYIPINKRLWSLSFVSISAIFAFASMTVLYILMDVYECHRTFLLKLLISAGKNPIFLYVGHSICAGMLPWQFHVDESSHLQLLLRLCWSTFCWLLVAHYMASKRLFIRV